MSDQTEIGDLGRTVSGEQDIARLEIAMDEPALMRELDADATVATSSAAWRGGCGLYPKN